MTTRRSALRLLPAVFFLSGCASLYRYEGTPPPKVAVLPFETMSNDVNSSEAVRKAVWERFKQFGFVVAPLDQIDAAIRPLGISQGGQLRATTAEKLAAATGADLLCYGMVVKFDHITLGVVEKRDVKVTARLTSRTGTNVWSQTREASKSESHFGSLSSFGSLTSTLGGQLRDKLIEGAIVGKLAPETNAVVEQLVRSLPRQGLP